MSSSARSASGDRAIAPHFSRDRAGSAPIRASLGASLFTYAGALAAAQILLTIGKAGLGAAIAATLVLVLVNHSIHAHDGDARTAYACLALVSVVVLVRHALAVGLTAREPQHVVWVVALILAASLALRRVGRRPKQPRTLVGDWSIGAVLVLGGPALGVGAYAVAFSAAEAAAPAISLTAAALVVFAVIGEELLFRGALQRALMRAAGNRGVAFTILLFALTYLDVEPHGYAAVIASTGALFSLAVAWNAPLIAIVGARVLLTLTLLSLLPRLAT